MAATATHQQIAMLHNSAENYIFALEHHPIGTLCQHGEVPKRILERFARAQYVDSILWVPMLSIILGRIREPRLVEAVRANIACETGCAGNIPHPTICAQFLKSIGVLPQFGEWQNYSPISGQTVMVMNAVHGMTEAMLCGWLIAAEALVPPLFRIFRPAFARMAGCDLTYFDEHIVVDAEEHAQWMWESAEALIANSSRPTEKANEILTGLDVGGRVTLSVPDIIYAQCLTEGK